MENMGSLSLVFIVYNLKVILIGVIILLQGMTYLNSSTQVKERVKNLKKWLIKDTFYNQVIAVALESYFEFLISGYLHLRYSEDLVKYGATHRGLEESIDEKFDSQY